MTSRKKPSEIRRVYIPKPNGDKRPLGIPTIADRINQDIIRRAIEPICEFHLAECSYGFRPKRSCQDAMIDLFNKLNKKQSRRWIVEGDIKGYFNHIRHDQIMSTLKEWNVGKGTRLVIQKMLSAGVLEEGITTPTETGTPQGGIISLMLANIALTCLDNKMIHFDVNKRRMHLIVRYADDFIIIAKSKEEAMKIKQDVKEFLMKEVGLELSDKKTHITEISKGFDFLGFNFKQYKDTLLIKPSKNNLQLLMKKMSRIIRQSKSSREIIAKLNPVIRGWCNYYRHVVSKRTFYKIEHLLWHQLWQWIRKKHPTSSIKYRIRKYFTMKKGKRWQFYDAETNYRLFEAGSMPIKRFIKVKIGKRVYDVKAIDYWQQREYLNAKNSINAERSYMQMFTRQRGRCTVCNHRITETDIKGSKVHKHHMKPRSKGGNWKLDNLRLLHQECHTKLHGIFSRSDMAKYMDKGIDYLRLMKPIKS